MPRRTASIRASRLAPANRELSPSVTAELRSNHSSWAVGEPCGVVGGAPTTTTGLGDIAPQIVAHVEEVLGSFTEVGSDKVEQLAGVPCRLPGQPSVEPVVLGPHPAAGQQLAHERLREGRVGDEDDAPSRLAPGGSQPLGRPGHGPADVALDLHLGVDQALGREGSEPEAKGSLLGYSSQGDVATPPGAEVSVASRRAAA